MRSGKGLIIFWKFLYGVIFVVLLPLLLIIWSQLTEEHIFVPVVNAFIPGLIIAASGGIITFFGIMTLIFFGEGLPMNAFPPEKFVSQGIYRFIPHPIYFGFSILCIGWSISAGSAAGLWLVSPIVILSCTALVQGFEKHEIRNRFGSCLPRPYLSLPANEGRATLWNEIVSVYFIVFLPWLVLYEAVGLIGIPPDAVSAYLPFEKNFPVIEWTEIIYGSTYIYVLLIPLTIKSAQQLRQFAITGLVATLLMNIVYLTIPLIAPPKDFTPEGILGVLLMVERTYDTPAAAFPSFHVVWAFLASKFYSQAIPKLKFVWWSIAVLISISCITTGMHALVDVIAGILMFLFLGNLQKVWSWIRNVSEKIANSWKEWHFGSVRVINHGMYTGLGSFFGLLVVGGLLGADQVRYALIVSFSSIICAGLWAQFIEGSPRLLRPYGYYGGILGAIMGAIFAWLLGGNFWLLLGAYSVAGPWIQALGRIRCLVQGCCHGREASEEIGIRFVRPTSRVSKIAGLKGIPLHPTQVYSMLWNIFCGFILGRLWSLHVSLPLISGIYLVLNGLGRFVEESYRGEPQTPIFGRMRLYQWMSIASVLFGIGLTTLDVNIAIPDLSLNWSSFIAGISFGLFTWFAQGVDFPNSNKRFARLT